MIVLPQDWAYDMLLFAQRNPPPMPLPDGRRPAAHRARSVHGASLHWAES